MSLMNNGPAPADGAVQPSAAAPQMSSPILQEAEQKNEAGLAPDNLENYKKIVVAGMAAGLTRGPQSIVARLLKSPDPVKGAARGAVALALILRREAKGVMPIKAMVPAAISLMLHALDFVNRAGKVQIGPQELDRAGRIFANDMFSAFNITPAMLQRATAQVHAVTMDPQKMELVHRKLGSVVAPGASQATPMPS